MKTKYLYILLLAILSTAMFSSCDSLWQVQEGKNSISFELSVSDLMHSINSENTFFSETQARNNSIIQTLEVSLLDSDTNEELAPSQNVVVTSVNERISVEFPNLSHVGKSFYVKIAVTLQNAEIITIESKKQIMKSGINPVTFTKYDIATDITIVLSDASKTAFDVVVNPDDEDFVTSRTVTVYDASNNDIIAVKMLSKVELVQDVEIVFSGIPIGAEVYAVLEVLGGNYYPTPDGNYRVAIDPTLFRARTENAIIESANSELIAHPNAIFLSPGVAIDGIMGDNNYPGVIPFAPVATWDDALEKLKVDGTLLPDATIYVKGSITPTEASTIIDGDGVILKKYASGVTIILVENTNVSEVILKNITLDGNTAITDFTQYNLNEPGGPFKYDDSALVEIKNILSSPTLKLTENTVITNSRGGGVKLTKGNLELEVNPIVTGNYFHSADGTISVAQNIYIESREVELTVTNLNNANVGIATDLLSGTVFSNTVSYPSDILNFIKPDGEYEFALDDNTIRLAPARNASGVYMLNDAFELGWFRDYVNAGNANVDAVLTTDIDLPSEHWEAIGSDGVEYSGTFDGQGHSITGLAFDSGNYSGDTGTNNGLFGTVSGGTIKNVLVEIVLDASAKDKSGVVVGNAINETRIINVGSSGSIAIENFGGIVGILDNSTITSCFSGVNGPPNYTYKVVADKNNATTITECYYDNSDGAYWKQTEDGESAVGSIEDFTLIEAIIAGMNTSNGSESFEWVYNSGFKLQ